MVMQCNETQWQVCGHRLEYSCSFLQQEHTNSHHPGQQPNFLPHICLVKSSSGAPCNTTCTNWDSMKSHLRDHGIRGDQAVANRDYSLAVCQLTKLVLCKSTFNSFDDYMNHQTAGHHAYG